VCVRRLTVGDFPAYAALVNEIDAFHYQALPRLITPPSQSRPRASEYEAAIRDPDQRLFGADAGNALRGFVHAQLFHGSGGRVHRPLRYISVELIGVARGSRRKGIGRALMAAVIEWARSRKVKVVHLGVYEFNRNAASFYQRLGFKVLTRYMDFEVF
jgi:GNAT superfamily N-acetyltransferase